MNKILYSKDGNGKKVMVSFLKAVPEIVITNVNSEKKTAEFECPDKSFQKHLCGRAVFQDDNFVGIVRNKKDSEDKFFIELFGDINIADKCRLKLDTVRMDNLLCGYDLINEVPERICKIISDMSVDSDCDIVISESASEQSLKLLAKQIKPDVIYHICLVEENDLLKPGEGCGIIFKDGNYILKSEYKEKFTALLCENDRQPKFYFGSRSKLLEELSVSGLLAKVIGICIPASNPESPLPVIDMRDIEDAARLLAIFLNNTEGIFDEQ